MKPIQPSAVQEVHERAPSYNDRSIALNRFHASHIENFRETVTIGIAVFNNSKKIEIADRLNVCFEFSGNMGKSSLNDSRENQTWHHSMAKVLVNCIFY